MAFSPVTGFTPPAAGAYGRSAGYRPRGPSKGIAFPRGSLRAIPRTLGPAKGIPFPGGGPQAIPRTAAPPAAPAAPPGAPPAPAASPLDALYQLNVGDRTAQTNARIAGINQTSGYARTDLQSALAKLAGQRPLDETNLRNRENSRGLLYSGNYGQQEGLLGQSYASRQGGLQQNFDRGQAARQSEIAGLQQALSTYGGREYLSAVERASLAAQNNPDLGAEQTPAPAALAVPQAAKPPVPGAVTKGIPFRPQVVRRGVRKGIPFHPQILRG